MVAFPTLSEKPVALPPAIPAESKVVGAATGGSTGVIGAEVRAGAVLALHTQAK